MAIPEGVKLLDDLETMVATVSHARVEEPEAAVEEVPEGEGEAPAGEAAAEAPEAEASGD